MWDHQVGSHSITLCFGDRFISKTGEQAPIKLNVLHVLPHPEYPESQVVGIPVRDHRTHHVLVSTSWLAALSRSKMAQNGP